MRIPVEMPKLGFDEESGRLVGWLKQVGDRVERGESLAEVETQKAVFEMEALASGILVEIVRVSDEVVAVGDVIAWLDDEG